jgi:hypothetical protein
MNQDLSQGLMGPFELMSQTIVVSFRTCPSIIQLIHRAANHWVIQVSGSNNTIAIDCNHGAVFTLRSWDQLRSAQSSIESFFTADEGDETSSLKIRRLSQNCQRTYEATQMILCQSNPGSCMFRLLSGFTTNQSLLPRDR